MNSTISNQDYERAILSGIIFDPESIRDVQEKGLCASDFYHPFHKKLFLALEYLYEHSAIEENIIKQYMGKAFDETAMLDILATMPISNNKIYIDKVKEYAKLRDFKKLAYQILQKVDEDNSLDDTLDLVHKELDKVEEGNRELFNIVTLDQVEAEEAVFICKNWLPFPKNTVSLVSAGGGVGKSFLLLQALSLLLYFSCQ